MAKPRAIALFSLMLAVTAQDQPTFRSGTRLVEVSVVVRDKNGPVAGLTKENFTLLDEGKQRPISFFAVTASRGPQTQAVPLPAGTFSNRLNRQGELPATATILMIDRLNTPIDNQLYANQKVVRFLQAKGNRDRIGIYTLGSSVRILQDLTYDPARLDRAAKSLKPQDAKRLSADGVRAESTGDATVDGMVTRGLEELQDFVVEDRVKTTSDALLAIARHLAKVPGRKNLIWVSGSFPLVILREHKTVNFSKDVDEAARALNDANVAVYPVDARGLMGASVLTADQSGQPAGNCIKAGVPCIVPSDRPGGVSGIDTMNTLADLTGGRAFYNTNGIEDSIQRAAQDAELTYTLGFHIPEDAFDEKFHKLTVKVDKKGVDVRFRKGYFASEPAAQSAPLTLNQLVREALDATAIGLTVATVADPARPGVYQARVSVDLHDVHLEQQGGLRVGNIDVALFVMGSKTVRTIARNIEIPEDQLAAALEKGIVVNDSIVLDGPSADLKIVVRDRSTGAAGSILVPLGRR